jgi:hypothetical protein
MNFNYYFFLKTAIIFFVEIFVGYVFTKNSFFTHCNSQAKQNTFRHKGHKLQIPQHLCDDDTILTITVYTAHFFRRFYVLWWHEKISGRNLKKGNNFFGGVQVG